MALMFLALGGVQVAVLISTKPFASARRSYLDYAHRCLVRGAKSSQIKGSNPEVVKVSNSIKQLRKNAGPGWRSVEDLAALSVVTTKLTGAKLSESASAIEQRVKAFCEKVKLAIAEHARQERI